jgi:hypothetical protein
VFGIVIDTEGALIFDWNRWFDFTSADLPNVCTGTSTDPLKEDIPFNAVFVVFVDADGVLLLDWTRWFTFISVDPPSVCTGTPIDPLKEDILFNVGLPLRKFLAEILREPWFLPEMKDGVTPAFFFLISVRITFLMAPLGVFVTCTV